MVVTRFVLSSSRVATLDSRKSEELRAGDAGLGDASDAGEVGGLGLGEDRTLMLR